MAFGANCPWCERPLGLSKVCACGYDSSKTSDNTVTTNTVALPPVVLPPNEKSTPPAPSLPIPVPPVAVTSKTKLYMGIGFGVVLTCVGVFTFVNSRQNVPTVAESVAPNETSLEPAAGFAVDSLARPIAETTILATSDSVAKDAVTLETADNVATPNAPQIYPPDSEEIVSGVVPLHARPAPIYTNARQAAESLNLAFATIGRSDATFDQLIEAGRAQQLIFRSLALNPSLEIEVLPLLDDDVRSDTASQVETSRLLRSTAKPQATLPKWRIVETLEPSELITLYKEAEAATGVDWRYLAAINIVESRVGRIRGTSYSGARGPMQFMPKTWAAYGRGDIESYPDSIQAAARYLVANGAPNNMNKALFAYNHSDAYVASIQGYVERMRSQPNRFIAYYGYQIIYRWRNGDVILDTGYDAS
jgi:soluble lytic murein transglycosylase-like protein